MLWEEGKAIMVAVAASSLLDVLASGEIIGEQEAERRNEDDRNRGRDNFIFWIRENFGEKSSVQTIVDPTSIGNIGRYLNHSCDPNLAACPVRVECLVPRVAMFAQRDISSGDELTFDYGVESCSEDRPDTPFKKCFCGSPKCRGRLPFHCFAAK